eukprot:4297675-Amphidinium_carterae.1
MGLPSHVAPAAMFCCRSAYQKQAVLEHLAARCSVRCHPVASQNRRLAHVLERNIHSTRNVSTSAGTASQSIHRD